MNCKDDCKHFNVCFRYASTIGIGFGIDTGFNPDKCTYFAPKPSLIRLICAIWDGIMGTAKNWRR